MMTKRKSNAFHVRLQRGNLSRRDMLTLIGWAGAATVSGCAVNPVTGEKQLLLMSTSQEIAIDQEQAPHQFSSDYGVIQHEAINRYTASVGTQLARNSHRPDMPYSFQVVNANYINAYAFPGGSIAVTRGLMAELKNEAELSALIGHEIGHVNARHTAERVTKNTLSGWVLAGVSAVAMRSDNEKYAALAQGLGGVAAGALLAHYSRNDEREADALGMEYMAKTGYNPHGMVSLMDILRQQSSHQPSALEVMFSTHPMSEERYQTAFKQTTSTYRALRDYPYYSERFMDETAAIRQLKPVIRQLQNAERLMMQESFSQAESVLRDALAQAPDDYPALVLMAKTLMAQNRHAEAQSWLNKARQQYPEEAQAQHLLGIASLNQQDFEGALQQFSRYQRLLPGNPNTLFFIGTAFDGMGDTTQAARYYQAFLQRVPSGEQAVHAINRLQSFQ